MAACRSLTPPSVNRSVQVASRPMKTGALPPTNGGRAASRCWKTSRYMAWPEFTTAVVVAQRDFAMFLARKSATFNEETTMATTLKKLSDAEITQKLAGLKGWQREGDAITKEF